MSLRSGTGRSCMDVVLLLRNSCHQDTCVFSAQHTSEVSWSQCSATDIGNELTVVTVHIHSYSFIHKTQLYNSMASLGGGADRLGWHPPGVTAERKKLVGKFIKNNGQTRSDRWKWCGVTPSVAAPGDTHPSDATEFTIEIKWKWESNKWWYSERWAWTAF